MRTKNSTLRSTGKLALLLLLVASVVAPFSAHAVIDKNNFKSKDKPIEITSDSLEILQQKNKAIFTGHVVATQGDVRIKSEKMTVHYRNSDKNGQAGNKKPEKRSLNMEATTEKNAIEKIIVEKNVFLSTPDETASGKTGIYDVANHKIFLNDNVVLTRDKNVLKGDRLVYNFETGKSEMNASETGNKGTGKKKRQRVKVLFVPSGNEKLPSRKKSKE